MDPKRAADKVVNAIHSAVNVAVLAALLLLLAFSLYVQWDSGYVVSSANAQAYEMYKPEDSEHLTFDQLVEKNPEVFGWLTLDGTKIDYPVAQSADNAKYVNTSPLGEYSLSGTIFLDYRNDRSITNAVSILYGHHMEYDEMFGGLDSFADGSYFDGHRTGNLYFDGANHKLQVFAALEADGYDTQVYDPRLQESGKDAYLALIQQRSMVYRSDFDSSLPILLMSTCESGQTNGRILLAATVGPPEDLTAQGDGSSGISIWLKLLLAAIIAALGLLLILLLRRRQKRHEGSGDIGERGVHEAEGSPAGSKGREAVETSMKGRKSDTMAATARGKHYAATQAEDAGGWGGVEGRDFGPQLPLAQDILALLGKIAGIAAVIVVLFAFVFGVHIESGTSMVSAVHDRDMVVYYRVDKSPDVRDLVVYETPEGATCVGRVVAAAGDSVDVTSEGLKVNGYAQTEEYAKGETLAFVNGVDYPVSLATGEYFVLADNREQGEDSRLFGPVSTDHIKGRVITVIRRRDF